MVGNLLYQTYFRLKLIWQYHKYIYINLLKKNPNLLGTIHLYGNVLLFYEYFPAQKVRAKKQCLFPFFIFFLSNLWKNFFCKVQILYWPLIFDFLSVIVLKFQQIHLLPLHVSKYCWMKKVQTLTRYNILQRACLSYYTVLLQYF